MDIQKNAIDSGWYNRILSKRISSKDRKFMK